MYTAQFRKSKYTNGREKMSLVTGHQIISPAIDFKKVEYDSGYYTYTKVFPLGGTNTINIIPTGSGESYFEVPAMTPINPSKFLLGYTATPALVANNYNWVAQDKVTNIDEIKWETREGVVMADVKYVENYTQTVTKKETNMQDFLSKDITESLYRSNGSVASQAAMRFDASASSLSYTEPAYILGGTQGAQTPVDYSRTKFSDLKNSLFAVDKDIMFPDITYIHVLWGRGDKSWWYSTAVNDPTAGAAAVVGNVVLTGVTLYVAQEQNEAIRDDLRDMVNSGKFSMLIPYVQSFKYNLSGTSQTVTVNLTRGNGHSLKKVIHTLYNNTESKNLCQDHSNINGAKITSYGTYLNDRRLQQYDLQCAGATLDDWMFMKEKIKNSPMGQNSNVFQYNWCHEDNFDGIPIQGEEKLPLPADNVMSGVSLKDPVKWVFLATTVNGTYFHYTFVVTQRTLQFTGQSGGKPKIECF